MRNILEVIDAIIQEIPASVNAIDRDCFLKDTQKIKELAVFWPQEILDDLWFGLTVATRDLLGNELFEIGCPKWKLSVAKKLRGDDYRLCSR